jgi:hypothetical protein
MANQSAISQSMGALTDYKNIGNVKSSKVSIPCETVNTYTSSLQTGDISFSLPTQPYSFIDTKQTAFCFNLKTDTAATFCNGNALSLIKQIEITVGSSIVDTLTQADIFSAMILDHSSSERSIKLHSLMSGASSTTYKTGGELTTAIQRFSIPLFCCLGLLSESYWPATQEGVKVRITLQNGASALLAPAAGVPEYTLTDMSIQMNYNEVAPQVYNQLLSEAGGVWKVKSTSVRAFTSHIDLANNQHTIPINANNRSVKSIYTVFRPSASLNNAEVNTCGGRVFPKLIRGQTQVGTTLYPRLPVMCGTQTVALAGELMSELVRTFHSAHSPSFTPCYSLADYIVEDYNNKGCFVYAIDFEEAGSSQSLETGVNTHNLSIFSQFETRTGESATPITVDTFVCSDLLIELSQDGSVRVHL